MVRFFGFVVVFCFLLSLLDFSEQLQLVGALVWWCAAFCSLRSSSVPVEGPVCWLLVREESQYLLHYLLETLSAVLSVTVEIKLLTADKARTQLKTNKIKIKKC